MSFNVEMPSFYRTWVSSIEPQPLCIPFTNWFSAMVVRARLAVGDGESSGVFGLLSDGFTFHFYRLSHDMKVKYIHLLEVIVANIRVVHCTYRALDNGDNRTVYNQGSSVLYYPGRR